MRRTLTNIGLTFAGLALGVIVVETPALLGWVDYRFLAGGMEARRVLPAPRPHPPGKHLAGTELGDLVEPLRLRDTKAYPYDFRADRRGFRNPRDLERADVVVIGDSFVENARLADGELLTAQLATSLGVDVISLGRSGYGPVTELETLRRHIAELRPKVVVWVFFEGNDLADVAALTDPRASRFRQRSFARNLWAAAELGIEDARAATGNDRAAGRRCIPSCPDGGCEPLYFGFRGQPLGDDEEVALATTFEVLDDARRLSRDAGATLALAFAPTKFRVYRDLCMKPLSTEMESWILNDLPERLGRWSVDNRVAFVDLTGHLQGAARRGEQVYFGDDTHWNARATAVAAAAIAELARVTPEAAT